MIRMTSGVTHLAAVGTVPEERVETLATRREAPQPLKREQVESGSSQGPSAGFGSSGWGKRGGGHHQVETWFRRGEEVEQDARL